MTRVFKTLFLSSFLFIALSASGKEFNRAKMDGLITAIEQSDKGMGAISIFHKGVEIYQRGYGYADIESGLKATAETKYRIGSVSKVYTATIIMKLIEEQKLSLDTKLSDFYPAVKGADKITIDQLLSHRSGIFNFTSAPDYLKWNTQPLTHDQLLAKIVAGGSEFEPGSNVAYSNSNYVLLAFIAERVGQAPLTTLLERIITTPCNLKDTYIGGKIDIAKGEANSYTKKAEWKLESQTDMSIPIGAGSITSTAFDINSFLVQLLAGKIVSLESIEFMKGDEDRPFGCGLFTAPFYQNKGYGHTGGIDGFQAAAFCFPEIEVSVALLSNGMTIAQNDILAASLLIFSDMEYEIPEFKKAVVLDSSELFQYLGTYAHPALPFKITINEDDGVLMAEVSGQATIPLEAMGDHKFSFEPAGLVFEFVANESKMILHQAGQEIEMKKEEMDFMDIM